MAQPPLVRVAAHAGFGRVVFAFAAVAGFHMEQDADQVTLQFDQPDDVPDAGQTRNVLSVRGGPGRAEIATVPGARVHTMQIGSRVVVDVLDPVAKLKPKAVIAKTPVLRPASAPSAPPVTVSPPAPASPAPPSDVAVQLPAARVSQQPIDPPAAAVPLAPAPPPGEVVAISAAPVALPAATGSGALIPFGRQVGAAAFRRIDGDEIVFDERRPIDLRALHDIPAFASATIQLLPAATLLRIDPSPGVQVRLTRRADGWLIAAGPPAAITPIEPSGKDGQVLLPAASPGQVVVVPDAITGQNLLVGTLRDASAGIAVARQTPEFTLAPTWQGVVAEPHTDRLALRVTSQGFVIESRETPLSLSPETDAASLLTDAAVLTRRFDFPNLPSAALLRRMQNEVASAATAPQLSRFRPRLAAAQTMLALGLGAEAEALLRLAMTEEPRFADDPDGKGLLAIAALLAGRPEEAGELLSDPALSGTDEIALWRATADAMRDRTSAAAPVFAATLPLILAYPAVLRDRLLPLAVETMANGGASAAADAVLARLPDEPLLAFARGLRAAARGETEQALTVFDALATGRDRLAAARAAAHAIELRLGTGALSPAEAAAALEHQFLAWRGDGRELALRLRAASLRGESGSPRAALALLRETDAIYPDAHADVQARMGELLTETLTGPGAQKLTPLEIVALAEENADVAAAALPAGTAALLADRLLALDLPRRAGPLLDTIMQLAAPGEARAAVGLRLARLRLGEDDAAGALAALSQSDAPDLAGPESEARTIVAARARARQGDGRAAAATLAALDTVPADAARVDILSALGDWTGAASAMAALVQKSIPSSGPLTPSQQDTVLRLASLQSEAGDIAGGRALGVKEGTRMSSSPQSALFTVLTSKPVNETGDLKRSASELALARAIPSNLAALGAK